MPPHFHASYYTAPWHLQPNGKPFAGLPAAISAVRTAYPDDIDLHRLAYGLLPRLPGKPRTSASLKEDGAYSSLNPLEHVITSDPWLGMNTEDAVNILWAETDGPDLRERLAAMREFGIRIPAWTTRGTRGGHIAFILKDPIVTGKPGRADADRRMLRKLSLTHSLLVTAINGDRSAGLRGMTKNPFHKKWTTEVGDLTPIDLDELLTGLQAMAKAEGWTPPKKRYRGDREQEPSPEGRNCALFDLTRWWAYDLEEQDGASILAKAMQINQTFDRPLGFGEVASVARSITRFMVTRFDGRGNGENAARDGAVLDAYIRLCTRNGFAPSQVRVAAEAGLSLSSVRRSWAKVWNVFVNKCSLSGSSINDAAVVPDEVASELKNEHEVEPRLSERVDSVCSKHLICEPQTILTFPKPPKHVAVRVKSDNVTWLDVGLDELDELRWSKRARTAYSKHERKAWHEKAAKCGLGDYRLDFAARLHVLFSDRRLAVDCCVSTVENMTARWVADADSGLADLIKAQDRMRLTRMGWASKIKAEERLYEKTKLTLPCNDNRRFRTERDAIDLIAERMK